MSTQMEIRLPKFEFHIYPGGYEAGQKDLAPVELDLVVHAVATEVGKLKILGLDNDAK